MILSATYDLQSCDSYLLTTASDIYREISFICVCGYRKRRLTRMKTIVDDIYLATGTLNMLHMHVVVFFLFFFRHESSIILMLAGQVPKFPPRCFITFVPRKSRRKIGLVTWHCIIMN